MFDIIYIVHLANGIHVVRVCVFFSIIKFFAAIFSIISAGVWKVLVTVVCTAANIFYYMIDAKFMR